MLTKIAWRNVWRNKGRSLVVIGSILVGIWALLFMVGFMNSFTISYINGAIQHEISHIQIHHPDFKKDFQIGYTIPKGLSIAESIPVEPGVEAVSPRSIATGMISSPRKANGVRIYGIYPELEKSVTHHDSLLVEGAYFGSGKRNPIVIGKELAEELKVNINSKVVLTFQDEENNLVSGAFRVTGLIETTSPTINKATAYVKMEDLNRIASIGDGIHEIALLLSNPENEPLILDKLKADHPNLLIESWRNLAPELELFLSMTDSFLWVLFGIIMVALIFGIINTMLMAVLERYRELGMLMAIGMNKGRVYVMIVIETIFLSLVGGPLGTLIGLVTMNWIGIHGIDLSAYSEGLREYGYSSILYPSIENSTYLYVTIGVVLTALIGALYPAYRAIQLDPTKALHMV
ncbi:ABC transporter permease [Echinicola jeungdonensis]|uniref:ABC transporter permease n=1 Tax=Echinicola jeungdonensis TaxID=709343 RepID=A0ABV5J3J6_9BACT|nr:FtsX-like permease family protein [Echinicola jeungdonensis]MDN3668217.1 ABC transporter permease [Echinicola jeungdonensis]